MMNNRCETLLLELCIAFFLLFIHSCTAVELCYEDYHPHRSAISVKYNWGTYAEDAPAEMNLIASRLYNTWRNHGIVDTESGECRQGLIPTGEADQIKESETPIPFMVRAGEYNFLTINAYEGLTIDELQSYLDDPAITSNQLFFRLEETKRDDLKELDGLDMPDFNPYFQYVHNPGRLYYGTIENEEIKTGEPRELLFTPVPISKQITIRFNIHTIGEIEIENMLAEMSGICGRFNIMEGYLDTTNLYRLLFLPKLEAVQQLPSENSEGKVENRYTYTATFHVIGLVPSYRSTYLTGPGILQLAIYATAGGKRRVFYAGANPRKDLVEAKIIHTVKGKSYLTDTEPITIDLSGELLIDVEHIINRDDGRFDTWFESDEGNVDIDV